MYFITEEYGECDKRQYIQDKSVCITGSEKCAVIHVYRVQHSYIRTEMNEGVEKVGRRG